MGVISGQAYWAHVMVPNTKFNPDGEYSIEICNLDDANLKIAEADGLTIKNKDDERGNFVTLKQYAKDRNGTQRAIPVTDSQLKPFPNEKRIGNGSTVNASYFPKPYTQYGGGVKGYLNKVQVVDLIEFTGGDALTPVQGGYVANTLDDDIPFAS
jgi:hypothetical protein